MLEYLVQGLVARQALHQFQLLWDLLHHDPAGPEVGDHFLERQRRLTLGRLDYRADPLSPLGVR
ncbi:hypothetical protein D3C80_2099060 [compost metagenome]